MPPTYREFKQHIRELEQKAELARRSELRQILVELRRTIREYGITPAQLFGPDLSDLVRFRDPETGKTWSGLGRPPSWIRGKDRDRFRVN
jgi:DNA-binding protein H-NS